MRSIFKKMLLVLLLGCSAHAAPFDMGYLVCHFRPLQPQSIFSLTPWRKYTDRNWVFAKNADGNPISLVGVFKKSDSAYQIYLESEKGVVHYCSKQVEAESLQQGRPLEFTTARLTPAVFSYRSYSSWYDYPIQYSPNSGTLVFSLERLAQSAFGTLSKEKIDRVNLHQFQEANDYLVAFSAAYEKSVVAATQSWIEKFNSAKNEKKALMILSNLPQSPLQKRIKEIYDKSKKNKNLGFYERSQVEIHLNQGRDMVVTLLNVFRKIHAAAQVAQDLPESAMQSKDTLVIDIQKNLASIYQGVHLLDSLVLNGLMSPKSSINIDIKNSLTLQYLESVRELVYSVTRILFQIEDDSAGVARVDEVFPDLRKFNLKLSRKRQPRKAVELHAEEPQPVVAAIEDRISSDLIEAQGPLEAPQKVIEPVEPGSDPALPVLLRPLVRVRPQPRPQPVVQVQAQPQAAAPAERIQISKYDYSVLDRLNSRQEISFQDYRNVFEHLVRDNPNHFQDRETSPQTKRALYFAVKINGVWVGHMAPLAKSKISSSRARLYSPLFFQTMGIVLNDLDVR